jgi:Tol biopolymer transport system component
VHFSYVDNIYSSAHNITGYQEAVLTRMQRSMTMKKHKPVLSTILVVITLLGPALGHMLPTLAQGPRATTRVSLASDGTQGNNFSSSPSISADGRYVAFESKASNLVGGDTNDVYDIFVHDRQAGTTTRVSLASDGTQGNQNFWAPSLSADGLHVAFTSYADNLVSEDTNGSSDVFVHDRQTGVTTRISLASDGTQGNENSWDPSVSADGRFVAFESSASNLVSGDTNGARDIFVRDRQTSITTCVSLASDGTQGNGNSVLPSLSADGRFVAFHSIASNLVNGDTNDVWDVFVHDRQTGVTTRVSLASDGTQGNGNSVLPSLSADGRFVAFESLASNLVSGDINDARHIFVHDRQTGVTTRVSLASDGAQGNGDSFDSSISTDGRFVAFESLASNLVSGDTNGARDVFVRDRQTGITTRVSLASDGAQGNGDSFDPSLSADGRFVAFVSDTDNLVSGDTNGVWDVFVHDQGQGEAATWMTIPISGGTLTSWAYHTTLAFSPQTFTTTVAVTYTGYFPARHPIPIAMTGIGHFFDLTAVYTDTGQPAQPTQPYSITVKYTDAEKGPAIEDTLALYYWNESGWIKESSSVLNIDANILIATPHHFSSWAVLGETYPMFLPVVLKN